MKLTKRIHSSNGMSIGRKGVLKAAQVLAVTGLDLFTDMELRSAAQAEFDKRSGGKSYQSLCKQGGPIGGHRPEQYEGHDQAQEDIAGVVTNSGNTK